MSLQAAIRRPPRRIPGDENVVKEIRRLDAHERSKHEGFRGLPDPIPAVQPRRIETRTNPEFERRYVQKRE